MYTGCRGMGLWVCRPEGELLEKAPQTMPRGRWVLCSVRAESCGKALRPREYGGGEPVHYGTLCRLNLYGQQGGWSGHRERDTCEEARASV